jgi:hypothetical protein
LQIVALLDSLSLFLLSGTCGNVFSSGLIHFLGVLGIDPEKRRFRTAKNYSYMLAGVVYCSRVLAAAKILPAVQDSNEIDDDYEDFLETRCKYLADGSLSPMSEMLSLLAYGKHIAHSQGNTGNAYWSEDKKIFYLNGRLIVIVRFCKMAQSIITDVSQQLWSLLWVRNIEDRFFINLVKIEDDIANIVHGMSFVIEAKNKLTSGLTWVLTRARSEEGSMRL